jgi:hypothetical protein
VYADSRKVDAEGLRGADHPDAAGSVIVIPDSQPGWSDLTQLLNCI